MSLKIHKTPSIQYVQNEGSAFQVTGMVLAGVGLIGGLVILIASGSAVLLGLVPIGLLVAMTGYLKQIAAATTASYILASNHQVVDEETPTQ